MVLRLNCRRWPVVSSPRAAFFATTSTIGCACSCRYVYRDERGSHLQCGAGSRDDFARIHRAGAGDRFFAESRLTLVGLTPDDWEIEYLEVGGMDDSIPASFVVPGLVYEVPIENLSPLAPATT